MTEPEPTPADSDAPDDTPHGGPSADGSTPRPDRSAPPAFNPRLAAIYAVGALVVVLVVALVLATLSSRSHEAKTPTVAAQTMQLGVSAGTFTATTLPNAGLVSMTGTITDLPSVAHGKPTVINLFSNSCTACRTEMPALQKLHQQAGDRFQMVGVDLGDSAATTKSFIRQMGVSYTIVRDPTSLLVSRLAITAQPMTLWVAADGSIVGHRYGAMTATEMRAALQDHLGISVPSA